MKKFLFFLMLTFILLGCEDQVDERYDRDSQFGGSLYSLLESKENYKLFLQAIDSAGMTRSLKGRGIHSVMAPNDSVFYAYLQKHNASTISEIPIEQLRAIVETHIVDKPFSREMIREFMERIPMRLHTLYRKGLERHLDILEGDEKLVYTGNKLMPIFTPENWAQQKIEDIAYNYDFFYENKWQGGKWKYGAATVESDVEQVGNGFLYKVDQVLEPSLNIEEYLSQDGERSKYKTLKKLFDTYQLFRHDEELTEFYGGESQERVYLKYNMPLSPVLIGAEYIDAYDNSYAYPIPMYAHQTVFAPQDEVLNSFIEEKLINETWTNIDEIPIFNKLMVLTSLAVEDYVWPEKVENKLALGNFDMPIRFSPKNDVDDRYLCSNGIFYGLNKMPEMPLFNSVIQEWITNPYYSYMGHMLLQTDHLIAVASEHQRYTVLLAPDDSWGDSGLEFDHGDLNIILDEKMIYEPFTDDVEGITYASRWIISNVLGNHILKGDGFDFANGGYKLFETLGSFGVVLLDLVSDSSPIKGFASDGLMESGVSSCAEIIGEKMQAENGEYIKISKPLSFSRLPLGNSLVNYNQKEFVALMIEGELLSKPNESKFWYVKALVAGNTTIFIPSDEVMLEAKSAGLYPYDISKPADFEEDRPDKPDFGASEEEMADYEAALTAFLERKRDSEVATEKYCLHIEKFVKNHIVPMAPFERFQYLLPNQNIDSKFIFDVELYYQDGEDYEVGVNVVMNGTTNTFSNLSNDETANIILDEDIFIASSALIYKIDKVINFNKK